MPIILTIILIILILLLQTIITPIILILNIILSFNTTRKINTLIFNNLFHFPKTNPTIPLYNFIFLITLNINYNIFLIS
ncbi:hypothetical protein DF186_24530, partial [Enterococcus hirae]